MMAQGREQGSWRWQDHGCADRHLRRHPKISKVGVKGQYTVEWSVLVAAMVISAMLMRGYVLDALRANVKSTEMQLNGAMQDNRP